MRILRALNARKSIGFVVHGGIVWPRGRLAKRKSRGPSESRNGCLNFGLTANALRQLITARTQLLRSVGQAVYHTPE